MKISALRTTMSREKHRNFIFVEVETDEGLTGVGEAYSVGPDEAIADIVRHWEPWLVGDDPRAVEGIWQKIWNFSRFPLGFIGMSALSAIDMALWDLAGKIAGQPCWALLGGKCRDRVRAYVHINGSSPSTWAQKAADSPVTHTFDAFKCFPLGMSGPSTPEWRVLMRDAEKRLGELRDTLGWDVDLAIDCHAVIYNAADAIEFCRMAEQFRPFFVEEPVRADNLDVLAQVVRSSRVPVATGEMLYTKWAFRDLLDMGGAHIVQPDICIAGGLTESRKIAAVAETYQATVAPHNPMGPVATAASVHLCAVIPNALILEYIPDDTPERTDIVDTPVACENGCLVVPDAPGLGISLNHDGIAEHPPQEWHRNFRYRRDGFPAHI